MLLAVAVGLGGLALLGVAIRSGGWPAGTLGATAFLAAPLAWLLGDAVDGRSEAARRVTRWLVAPAALAAGAVLAGLDLALPARTLQRVHAVGLGLLLASTWVWWALGQATVRALFEARPGWLGVAPARVKAGLGWYLVFALGTAGTLFATLGPAAVGPVWLPPRHRVPLAIVGALGSGLVVLLGARAARRAWAGEDDEEPAARADEEPVDQGPRRSRAM